MVKHKLEHAAAMVPDECFEALAEFLAAWFIQKHASTESEYSTDMNHSFGNQRDCNRLPREKA